MSTKKSYYAQALRVYIYIYMYVISAAVRERHSRCQSTSFGEIPYTVIDVFVALYEKIIIKRRLWNHAAPVLYDTGKRQTGSVCRVAAPRLPVLGPPSPLALRDALKLWYSPTRSKNIRFEVGRVFSRRVASVPTRTRPSRMSILFAKRTLETVLVVFTIGYTPYTHICT